LQSAANIHVGKAVRRTGPALAVFVQTKPQRKQTAFECTRENPDSSICLMSYIRYDGAPDMHLTACLPALMNHPLPSTDAPAAAAESPAATPAFSPLYQQIKGLILQSLQASEWKPGESIPSEMELAARYRVSQGTVRKAIDELASGTCSSASKAKAPLWPPMPSTRCSTVF
jgi:hypothetical protein